MSKLRWASVLSSEARSQRLLPPSEHGLDRLLRPGRVLVKLWVPFRYRQLSGGQVGDLSQISEILTEKGRRVLKIDADASVLEAVELMVEENVGSLLVTDSGDVTGIVTERDYLRRVALEGRTDAETSVREIMSSPLIVVTPETAIAECMALMTNKRIRHLPVVDAGEVAGIISIGDLVKFQSRQQGYEIQFLHDYISAR